MDMRKEIEAFGVQEKLFGPDIHTTVTAEVFVSLHQNASGGQVTWGVKDPVRVLVEEDTSALTAIEGADVEPLEDKTCRLSELTAYQRRLLDAAILEWVIDEQLSVKGGA
jgi:hypothetical protein